MNHARSGSRTVIAHLAAATIVIGACEPCDGFPCSPNLADAGRKAEDLGSYLAVQRADELAGGNMVVGTAAPLAGGGRFTFDIRANRITRSLPSTDGIVVRTDGIPGQSDFHATHQHATAWSADFAVGLTRGAIAGSSRIGGLDLTGTVIFMPEIGDPRASVASAGHVGGGLGVRVGLLEETQMLPGVSLAASIRSVPGVRFEYANVPTSDGGNVTISSGAIGLSVQGWRLAALKVIGRAGVTAGVGIDNYRMHATYSVSVASPDYPASGSLQHGSQTDHFTFGRNNLFVGGSYRLGRITVAGEYGHISQRGASDVVTNNRIDGGGVERSRSYLTLGIRLTSTR